MNIKAIPTTYRGIRFRSRLEATWAAFFDECRWEWEYEPLDLNGWMPDFILTPGKQQFLVEVKPITALDWLQAEPYLSKLEKSGSSIPIVLVGCSLFDGELVDFSLGWMWRSLTGDDIEHFENTEWPDHPGWETTELGFCNACGAVAFCERSYEGLGRSSCCDTQAMCEPGRFHICKELWPRDPSPLGRKVTTGKLTISSYWARAKNAVQWRR